MQEIELDNEPSCLSVVRTFISDYLEDLGVPQSEAFDILLALNEAVGNAHRHGRRNGRGRISVRCDLEDDVLRFVVNDDGHGFKYTPAMAEMPDPFQSSGRGLYLMNELMDQVDVRSGSSGTRIALNRKAPIKVSC